MSLEWRHESQPVHWDEDKARVIGNEEAGVFDRRFAGCSVGDVVPGEWWRVVDDGRTVGFGWIDVVWGDAEILLATDGQARGRGVGTFTLEHLEQEARKRGLNHLYNAVRPTHPDRKAVTAWLEKRGFKASEDGSLLQTVIPVEKG